MGNKVAKHFSEAKMARTEKRFICNHRHARKASKRFNRADRRASKLNLRNL
jgi:hypothetical protein